MNKKDIIFFIKRHQFKILFLIILIILVVPNIILLAKFKQIPSPIYGGDAYHQLGAIEFVKQGGNPFVSFATINDSIPGYMPLYSLVVGNFAKLGFDSVVSIYIFAILGLILAFYSMFLLSNHIIKDKYCALLVSLFVCELGFPMIKYGWFVKPTIFVLFFYFLFRFFENRNVKNALISGLFYGLNGLGHGTTFMISSLILFFGFFWLNKEINFNKFKDYFKKTIKQNLNYILIFFIGFGISLIHWFTLFINFGNFPNKLTEWGQVNYRLGLVRKEFLKEIFNFFFSFNNINSIIFFVFVLIFIIILFIKGNKKFNQTKNNSLFFIFLLIILPFHFFITLPLFNTDFSPHFMWSFGSYIIKGMLISVVFLFLLKIRLFKKYKKIIFISLTILFLILSLSSFIRLTKENKWIRAGLYSEINPILIESQKAILNLTNIDDNFISTKELGSAINALTGRRFLSIRRNQHPLTSQVDQRELDLAIILYGNDSYKRKELIKKYNINFFYWDFFWIQSEFIFDDSNKIVGFFDPILIIRTLEREEELKKYNISYSIKHMVLDSAKRNMASTIKSFDVLVVYPYNWSNEPWHPDFNNYIEEEWSFEKEGVKLARLFRVNVK